MKSLIISATSLLLSFHSCHLMGEETKKSIVPIESSIDDFDARLALARIYSHETKTKNAALEQYQWLLKQKPDDIEVISELSSLYFSMKKYNEGITLLNDALIKNPNNLNLQLTMAQAEAAVGHAEKARDHFLKIVNKDPSFLVKYADAMMTWGDFYLATDIYTHALSEDPSSLDLALKLAWSLESSERYEEAEEIYTRSLLDHPNNASILNSFAKLRIKERKFNDALDITETLINIDPANPKYLELKADIFYLQSQYFDAINAYNQLKSQEKYGVIARIGIGKSYRKLGRFDDAQVAFLEAHHLDPENIEATYYSRLSLSSLSKEWADLEMQNGAPCNALLIYQAIVESDPENFQAQISLAETLSILFRFDEAITIYQNLLDKFPGDSKLMKAIARVLGWSKNFDQSLQYYDCILEINPNDPTLYREKARTALWGKKFDIAMDSYNQLFCFQNDNIQQATFLEKRAKTFVWDKKFIHSLDAYTELLAFSPGNEEAQFDYAQSNCIVGLCDIAKNTYEDILNLDSGHSLVKIALERNELLTEYELRNSVTYWREIGIGSFSQSQIARYSLNTVLEIPITCRAHVRLMQQEYVENPFYNFKFYPAEGQTIEGDCQFNEYVKWSASVTYKNYFNEFKSTYTSRNYLFINLNDYAHVILACNKENEIYNYFSLKQAIQSVDSWITASSDITRYWNVSGTYQYYCYNDHNHQTHFNLLTEYQFTEDPDLFKLILEGNYRNTAHPSVSIFVGPTLVDVIHPYWTPIKYYSGVATLEYRHRYQFFDFCEAPQRYFDVKITGETDSTNNNSIQLVLEWKHEFTKNGGFELKGLIHRSPQWNAEGGWITAYFRF